MPHSKMTCILSFAASLIILAAGAGSLFAIDMPDNTCVVISKYHVSGAFGETAAPGAYGYDPVNDVFYTATYGSAMQLRKFMPGAETASGYGVVISGEGASVMLAQPDDILNMGKAHTPLSTGTYEEMSGSFATSSMVLNPVPITYNGVQYGAFSLAILSSPDYSALGFEDRKKLATFDLRTIGAATTDQPDYDTGWFADPADGIVKQMGSYGIADWNDVFTNLVSHEDLGEALGLDFFGMLMATPYPNIGRQARWSTDGTKVYFCAAAPGGTYGGVWQVDMTINTLTDRDNPNRLMRIVKEPDEAEVRNYCEPVCVPTTVRDFTGGQQTGDQVLFCGTSGTGNLMGINAVAPSSFDPCDPNNTPIYAVLDGMRFLDFMEVEDPCWHPNFQSDLPKVWNIATDTSGGLYFYARGPASVFRLDAEDRLVCVRNHPQGLAYNQSLGYTSGNVGTNKIQVREIGHPADPNNVSIAQVMFCSTGGRNIAGINVFQVGDFDRNAVVDVTDMEFFKSQLAVTWAAGAPLAMNESGFLDYMKADLNGSSRLNEERTALLAHSVNERDMRILWEFVIPGDADFDEDVDLADFAALADGYDPASTTSTWAEGDFDFDSDVDMIDLSLMMANWLENAAIVL